MAKIPASAFEKGFKKGDLKKARLPVYFLYGMDSIRVHSAAESVKDAFIDQLGGAECFSRILKLGDGSNETNIGEAIAGLNTVSMFGSGKMLWIGHLESIPAQADTALAAYAKNPNPQSTLIVTAVVEKKAMAAALEDSAFCQAAAGAGLAARFDSMRANEIAALVTEKLAGLGVTAEPEAAGLMAEYLAKDTGRLAMEIEKAAALAGYKGRLTARDVEASMTDMRMEEVWGLTGAFCAGDLPKSQAALDELLENGAEPQVILKTLTLEIMKSAAAGDVMRNGGSAEEFYSIMGENRFGLKNAWDGGRRWDLEKTRKALASILKAQMDIMTAGISPKTALEMVLLEASPMEKRR